MILFLVTVEHESMDKEEPSEPCQSARPYGRAGPCQPYSEPRTLPYSRNGFNPSNFYFINKYLQFQDKYII